MGLYRPRPKRIHKPLPPMGDVYDDRSIRDMLTSLRVKSQLLPRSRTTSDVDAFLEDLNRPLPKSSVIDYNPSPLSLYEYNSEDYMPVSHDYFLRKKIDDSRKDIEDFSRMLDARFRSKHGSTGSAIPISREAAEQSARENQRQRMMAAIIALQNDGEANYVGRVRGPQYRAVLRDQFFSDEEF